MRRITIGLMIGCVVFLSACQTEVSKPQIESIPLSHMEAGKQAIDYGVIIYGLLKQYSPYSTMSGVMDDKQPIPAYQDAEQGKQKIIVHLHAALSNKQKQEGLTEAETQLLNWLSTEESIRDVRELERIKGEIERTIGN